MKTSVRTLVSSLSVFFAFITICLNSFTILYAFKLSQDVQNSNNCIGDMNEYTENEMHPNVPQWEKIKSQKEKTTNYWLQTGIQHVHQKLNSRRNDNQHARNIIFFIGDGMSLATLAATRLYIGGEEKSLSFEKFPYTGLSRTYALDRLVTDSAAAATALFCGVKTQTGIIGLDGNAKRGACDVAKTKSSKLTSIAKWALDKQKWAGFVTTKRVTDATPAALYAHINERKWENDAELKKTCGLHTKMKDIGLQLMNGTIGERFKVIMGGGIAQLIDKQQHLSGQRSDGRNLINEFLAEKDNIFVTSKMASNWLQTNLTRTKRFLSLFSEDNLPYHLEIANVSETTSTTTTIPSLTEMTAKAIEILNENEKGYFLMVEAGNIDLAHHENRAKLAIDETAELGKAVAKALEMTSEHETLIVVTSDHGHTMSFAGYACRSKDIFGISNSNADDDLPYKILSYANGPSYYGIRNSNLKKERLDPIKKQSSNSGGSIPQNNENNKENNFEVFPATVPLISATHGGEDVPVFANGPWAHLFSGIYDQSTIPHLLAFAACLNNDEKDCK